MKKEKEIPHIFWKDYVEGDILERDKQLDVVINVFRSFINGDIGNSNIPEETRNHMFKTAMLGYFDDLIEYMEAKNE